MIFSVIPIAQLSFVSVLWVPRQALGSA